MRSFKLQDDEKAAKKLRIERLLKKLKKYQEDTPLLKPSIYFKNHLF